MPKKRFTSLYSKPQSTVHPSLNSSATPPGSTNNNDPPPTVNELISYLRKSNLSTPAAPPSAVTTPTLPPQIRRLLSQPETPDPPPRTRDRRRVDANGRRTRPAPPRSSCVEGSSRDAPVDDMRGRRRRRSSRRDERLYPRDLDHLPGLGAQHHKGMGLRDMCLRSMAREWEFVGQYERDNLADLPTGVAMLLLSYIALYGPEKGVGWEELRNLLVSPRDEDAMGRDLGEHNEDFYRLDLSGSIGRSIAFKHLIELVRTPTQLVDEDSTELSWEGSIPRPLGALIPHLTHLSISHPPPTILWPRLLAFSKYIPTLTHLSLAHWPVPTLTPNSKTAVIASELVGDIQYGGANYYSHSLDNDVHEAAMILRMLASRLYGLEYLDVAGCIDWLPAWRFRGDGEGVDWASQLMRLKILRVHGEVELGEESEFGEVSRFVRGVDEAFKLEKVLAQQVKRGGGGGMRWIEVGRDDWRVYDELWRGDDVETRRKRKLMDTLKAKNWSDIEIPSASENAEAGPALYRAVERRSVWEQ